MRLTLRTLLAYLDNTLDPVDAEALRLKLSESGFATQLVQRIRRTLVDASLTAPTPDAVNPVHEANVISEYIDSTLAPEQSAEIERACLESDVHLAEAAACHQILTMVLGTPADFPDELRKKIYDLPERAIQQLPVTGRISAVQIPDTPAPDSVLKPQSLEPVQPVGPGDSGVLRVSSQVNESRAAGDAGESSRRKPSPLAASDVYGGIRGSKWTPWVVALALAGVFLFAFSQAFAPIIRMFEDPVAQSNPVQVASDSDQDANDSDQDDGGQPDADQQSEAEQPDSDDMAKASSDGTSTSEKTPASEQTAASDASRADPSVAIEKQDPDAVDAAAPVANPDKPSDVEAVAASPKPSDASESDDPKESVPPPMIDPAIADASDSTPAKTVVDTAEPIAPVAGADKTEADPVVDPGSTAKPPVDSVAMNKDPAMEAPKADPAEEIVPAPEPKPDAPIDPAARKPIVQFVSDNQLALLVKGDKWIPIKKGAALNQTATILNAPKFRSQFSGGDGVTFDLVDASRVSFIAPAEGESVGLQLHQGRVLLSTDKPDVKVQLKLAEKSIALSLPTEKSVAAIEVRFVRRPGFDPFLEKNHLLLARIMQVNGDVLISSDIGNKKLAAGQQWMFRGDEAPKVNAVPPSSAWATAKDDSPLDASAREGLLDFLAQEQSPALSMREAIDFRKAEVASLAAQTMIRLGVADVYFGADGILSRPKQRSYWTEHFHVLRDMVNTSPESAGQVKAAIGKMDSANGKSIFRLLAGYSQSQLVEGGDEELVELLDSASMSVRVLAVENLREITGTTLNFRAEETIPGRRNTAIKKWRARQRRGDIRWEK